MPSLLCVARRWADIAAPGSGPLASVTDYGATSNEYVQPNRLYDSHTHRYMNPTGSLAPKRRPSGGCVWWCLRPTRHPTPSTPGRTRTSLPAHSSAVDELLLLGRAAGVGRRHRIAGVGGDGHGRAVLNVMPTPPPAAAALATAAAALGGAIQLVGRCQETDDEQACTCKRVRRCGSGGWLHTSEDQRRATAHWAAASRQLHGQV